MYPEPPQEEDKPHTLNQCLYPLPFPNLIPTLRATEPSEPHTLPPHPDMRLLLMTPKDHLTEEKSPMLIPLPAEDTRTATLNQLRLKELLMVELILMLMRPHLTEDNQKSLTQPRELPMVEPKHTLTQPLQEEENQN